MRQLQVFESVARHLSFTRAAEELHLTQPAVSMQVKQLESMVDIALFEQLGKKVHLTEAGRTMVKHSRKMMAQLNEIEKDINGLRGVDGGQLKICIASTVNYFATRLLSRFCDVYKSVGISLDVINREELIKRLEANQPDLVLMGQPPEELDVVAKAFMENPLIIIANPQHKLCGKKNIPLSAMANEVFVMREPGSGTRTAMKRVFRQYEVEPKFGVQLSSNETVKQSVEAGLGLAVVSAHTVDLELNAGRLVSLEVEHFPIMRKWFVAYRRGKKLSATAQIFLDFVLSEGGIQQESHNRSKATK
ncbi:MAG: LysR family transcriptional regulator [Gammaproteobacteria bacterium]|nr:LysR family transcriptional regulator [Gammaproteobacteria bacterium]